MGWLYNQISLPETIYRAWNRVAANDGRSGYDGQSIEDYSFRLEENLRSLSEALLTGLYKPGLLLKLVMLKPNGKERVLLIPGVMDRVAQTAASIVLYPIIDAELETCTFGYRHGISRQGAAREIDRLRAQGYRWVVDADIRNFFDSVDHDLLFTRLRELIDDEELLNLIRSWITAEIVDGSNPRTRNLKGLPQGCPISPVLANLFLDKFDERIEKEGFKLIRFADDFLILCKTKPNAESALKLTESILDKLKLELNNEKTRITTFAEGFKYLGYLFVKSLIIPTKMHPEEWYDKLGKFKLRRKPTQPVIHDPDNDEALSTYELETDQGEKIELTKEALEKTEFGRKLLEGIGKKKQSIDTFLENIARQDAKRQKERREALRKLYSPILNTLYLQDQGCLVRKENERLSVQKDGKELTDIITRRIDQIIVFGNISLTTPVMQFCLRKEIPITFLSQHGKFFGRLEATTADHTEIHRVQFLRSLDEPFALDIARSIVTAKIHNSRIMIQRRKALVHDRNGQTGKKIRDHLELMSSLEKNAKRCKELPALRGLEGKAAALYFELYGLLFKKNLPFYSETFKRVKRPPKDPVNSLLSFGYTLIHSNIYSMVRSKGLSPYMGYLHAEDKGNPALVNDLIEEFRTVIDSMVLYTLNRGLLTLDDFYYHKDKTGCFLTNEARKKYLKIFETRMWQESKDGYTGRTLNVRRHIEKQVGLLKDVMTGRLEEYAPYKLPF
ncbi:CRISPR-associated endonuclease Cas1 [Prosthecochloris sp. N3]|uniref:CRISPR-associated endonuclease Cas1 n=1 Tax=Prosthecochloris ethylica TaxID=2743976 RepID=A0ABR9XQU0_9CHLB|nr:CRISPR-associated endonuclease Cas1 [Prosthecochloris ethylica]MBF0585471.1 CRISPR-associated endonuclease Cas1 [Prosthecochloris ethylica]MBF0636257.1 CRISPR-associated endonuclease Cas1 [Prosthecochloris ethylica]NUK46701.1 CRISPR-associated endonuclease Cas1 [Prosthecochloris ethylica]